ncbi:MAG TPA: hypothetical protein PKA44_07485 [Saprospiraceae bacterium]|nr:hypothetical protein [Saprospiraceae bacterium]
MGFVLTPSGTTDNFMKFVPKGFTVSGTNYVTGYLTISAYKNLTTNQFTDPGIPVQKLQLQGGNILLCRTNNASTTPDLNPTSRNGAILFSDIVTTANNYINGKWGIEYDNQYSTGGLNFFKPVSSLTPSRINYNLFIRNDGNVGIGTGTPNTKLFVQGDATISDLANTKGDNIVVTDAVGKLILVNKSFAGDNMGNCEAGNNIKLSTKFISYDGTSNGILLDNNNDVGITSDIFVSGNVGVGGMIIGKPYTENYNKLQLKGSALPDAAYMELCDGSGDSWRSIKFITKGNTADYQFSIDSKYRLVIKKDEIVMGTRDDQLDLVVNGIVNTGMVQGSKLPDASRIELWPGGYDDFRSMKFTVSQKTSNYQFFINSIQKLVINEDRIVVGTEWNRINLNVNGNINTREVMVSLKDWDTYPDYVFQSEYQLRSLSELETFIMQNKHLPDVPTAAEVKDSGINIGEMNVVLLKKIEELTLYLIELKKENEIIKKSLNSKN